MQKLESTHMKQGDTWYLIDLPWLLRWLEYVYDAEEHARGTHLAGATAELATTRPGAITNRALVSPAGGLRPGA